MVVATKVKIKIKDNSELRKLCSRKVLIQIVKSYLI
jgi:hypothetical protein